MAKFVKGDWVRVLPSPDLFWKYWTEKHSSYCDQIVEVTQVEPSKNHPNVSFLLLTHFTGGSSVWFQDKHCVAEKSYDRVFAANMQRATDALNRNEKVAKKCRDDILREMFTPDDVWLTDTEEDWVDDDDEFFDEWDDDAVGMEDDLDEDWVDVPTKPMVPLPGKKKKTIKRSGKKIVKKAIANSLNTNSLDPKDWMSEEELTDYLTDLIGDDKSEVWGDPD